MRDEDFVPGGIANRAGDLWGTAPHRRVGAALLVGWRAIPKEGACHDDDYAWLERTPEEREAELARRT
jgi:hypothetical protein